MFTHAKRCLDLSDTFIFDGNVFISCSPSDEGGSILFNCNFPARTDTNTKAWNHLNNKFLLDTCFTMYEMGQVHNPIMQIYVKDDIEKTIASQWVRSWLSNFWRSSMDISVAKVFYQNWTCCSIDACCSKSIVPTRIILTVIVTACCPGYLIFEVFRYFCHWFIKTEHVAEVMAAAWSL